MRLVFMGSSELSCRCLEAIIRPESGVTRVVTVVTQPARPSGRGRAPTSCPAWILAQAAGLSTLTPVDVNAPDVVEHLASWRPDLIVVAAFGQLLKKALLDLPPLGCINLHASLLPKYRGAAPIQWAIARGETETGTTTQYMAARLDAGDIILSRPEPIRPNDTGGSLHDRLALAGADLLVQTIQRIVKGTAPRLPQNEADATYAPKLARSDGKIDWTLAAPALADRLRGFDPWPGSFCLAPQASADVTSTYRLKILKATLASGQGQPGQILAVGQDGILVAAGEGAVRLERVQSEGKRAMTAAEFMHGHPMCPGMILA